MEHLIPLSFLILALGAVVLTGVLLWQIPRTFVQFRSVLDLSEGILRQVEKDMKPITRDLQEATKHLNHLTEEVYEQYQDIQDILHGPIYLLEHLEKELVSSQSTLRQAVSQSKNRLTSLSIGIQEGLNVLKRGKDGGSGKTM